MSGICCCALAGTKACFTCPNSMSGVFDRYPAPYTKLELTEEYLQEHREQTRKFLEKVEEAHEAAGCSTLHFGHNYLRIDSYGDGAEEQVAPI